MQNQQETYEVASSMFNIISMTLSNDIKDNQLDSEELSFEHFIGPLVILCSQDSIDTSQEITETSMNS